MVERSSAQISGKERIIGNEKGPRFEHSRLHLILSQSLLGSTSQSIFSEAYCTEGHVREDGDDKICEQNGFICFAVKTRRNRSHFAAKKYNECEK